MAPTNGQTTKDVGLDKEWTENIIKAMGPKTDARLREVMGPLIRHIHDFAREVNLTVDEWMAGVQLVNWAGQMSNEKRNEGQLLCDVIGLESYVFFAGGDFFFAFVELTTHMCVDWWMISLFERLQMQQILLRLLPFWALSFDMITPCENSVAPFLCMMFLMDKLPMSMEL